MKSYSVILFILSVVTLLNLTGATFPKDNTVNENPQHQNGKVQEPLRSSPTESKPVFPKHLDLSSLQNMPLVILHPERPIQFQLLPGENLASIHKSLTPNKIMELIQSATSNSHSKLLPQGSHKKENRETINGHVRNHQPQASGNHVVSSESDSQFTDPALPRSFLNPNMNNGWLQRVKGSFSNMFPSFRPGGGNPHPMGLPSMNLPSYIPQASNMHGILSPFAPNPLQQYQSLPWRNNFHGYSGDLNTGASFMSPLKAMFSNLPIINLRPPSFRNPIFGGGFPDLATSGSAFIPRHVLPPPRFVLPPPPVQRHKPLFNDFGSLQAASMEISNAFADFTDSKEHGPEVTQKFGSVGHTINNFLKMMGLGPDLSFGPVGGYGGGANMAAMDSTPIARSMDFYPGYGNQAHFDDFENLDDIGDFPLFEEDITQEFMKKMNLTNETMVDDATMEKEILKMGVANTKTKLELMEKEKMPVIKEVEHKANDDKSKMNAEKDVLYAMIAPKKTMKEEENKPEKKEKPTVNYKIPSILATVAPRDRKQPVAIYQNFNHQDNNITKSPVYVPAEAMPPKEEEINPNKLVDDDVVRQWRLVNSGKGYVEKHPVPILDVLKTPKQPESLKVVHKVISDSVKKDSA